MLKSGDCCWLIFLANIAAYILTINWFNVGLWACLQNIVCTKRLLCLLTGPCPQECLNGAACTEAGDCDCQLFQAQGSRCQIGRCWAQRFHLQLQVRFKGQVFKTLLLTAHLWFLCSRIIIPQVAKKIKIRYVGVICRATSGTPTF